MREPPTVPRSWAFNGILCILFGSAIFFSGCRGDVQTVWSAQVRSPDGKWIAIGRTDQHGGPGNAAVVTGVFLAPALKPSDEHLMLNFFGDFPKDKGGISLTMQWLTPSHLQVTFNRHPDLNYQVVKYGDIEISVRDLP